MNADKLLLLQEDLRDLENAAAHLRFSLKRTQDLLDQPDWQPKSWNAWNHWPAGLHVYPICSYKK